MTPTGWRAFVFMGLWAVCAGKALAQVPPAGVTDPVAGDLRRHRADSLALEGHHGEALAAAHELLARSPGDYDLEVLAAQEGLLYSFLAPTVDSAKHVIHVAIEHAQRAMALDPQGEAGRYLNLAAHGRLGLIQSGPTERAHLAVVVDSAGRSLLESNPRHAGAQNALGRLYMEVADLNWISKIFARRWMGGALVSRATWEAAEEHLRKAAELEPTRNMYLLDLGALLVKRGRRDEARPVLQEAVRLPLESPAQEEFREAAQHLLAEIGEGPTAPPNA